MRQALTPPGPTLPGRLPQQLPPWPLPADATPVATGDPPPLQARPSAAASPLADGLVETLASVAGPPPERRATDADPPSPAALLLSARAPDATAASATCFGSPSLRSTASGSSAANPPAAEATATAVRAAPTPVMASSVQAALSGPGWVSLAPAGSTSTPRLWQWTANGVSSGLQNDRDTLVIAHGWLGSGVTSAPADPTGFNPAFTALAQAAAAAGRQVLFLDWGMQAMDPSPSGLAPYNAAGRIQSVATWARERLQTLASSGRRLSFAGHSLGSYLGAQTAVLLGAGLNLRVQALDPAASGLNGAYDINSANAVADPVPSFSNAAPGGSLAFVVADTNFSIGIAGDNARAATAARSFVVNGFASGTSATVAHGAIPALAADLSRYLPLDSEQGEAILSSFRADQFSDSGGSSGTLRHEGVVRLRSNSGAIARINGISTSGLSQTVHFVDSGDSDLPTGGSGVRDVVVSLRNLQLSATASVEEVVLGGSAALTARGSSQGERLNGNAAANLLSGEAGNDTLSGGLGNDTLTGGLGADRFRFDAALNGAGPVDRISDFSVAQGDRIELENSGAGLFNALVSPGSLASSAFVAGTSFSSASQRIRYEPGSGNLFYDPDGTGGGTARLFAILSTNLALTSNQFLVT